MLDVIVLLDERGHVAGGARRGNVRERLRRLRVEADARHVLREDGDEGKAEALIEIRHELIARHVLELPVVAEALLEGQVPIHVVGIPPGVLQALPEQTRLANAANLVAARHDTFFAILTHQVAQRMDELWFQILEAFVVRAEIVLETRTWKMEIRAGRRIARYEAGFVWAVLRNHRAVPLRTARNGCAIEEVPRCWPK